MTGREPAEIAGALERAAELPPGSDDRFSGYGVIGLPFRSGHVLALRRFPASSIGPDYRAVWHRDPDGRWTFYQDQPAELACTRYFGSAVAEVRDGPIGIEWPGPRALRVHAAELDWALDLASTPVTRLLSAVGGALPARAWRSGTVLAAMSRIAGPALRAGRVPLTGLTPNGQRFVANPLRMWVVTGSRATVRGVDVGPIGPVAEQARLRDFAIPQRGVFAAGHTRFAGG